jgi:hypothetical protein
LSVCAYNGIFFSLKKEGNCWMRLYTPVIPVLRRLKQEDWKFKSSLGTLRPCHKRKKREILTRYNIDAPSEHYAK